MKIKSEKARKDFRPSMEWLVEKCNELGNPLKGDWETLVVVYNTGLSTFVLNQSHVPTSDFSHKMAWKFLPQSDVHPDDVTLYSGARVENWKRDKRSTDTQIVISYKNEDDGGSEFRSAEFDLKKGEVLYVIKTREGAVKLLIEYVNLPEWFFIPQMGGKF